MIPGFYFQCSFRDTPVSNAPKIPIRLPVSTSKRLWCASVREAAVAPPHSWIAHPSNRNQSLECKTHSPEVELSFKVSVTSVLLENTLAAESDRRIRPVPLLDFWTCARAMSMLSDGESFSNTRMCEAFWFHWHGNCPSDLWVRGDSSKKEKLIVKYLELLILVESGGSSCWYESGTALRETGSRGGADPRRATGPALYHYKRILSVLLNQNSLLQQRRSKIAQDCETSSLTVEPGPCKK